MFGSGRPWNLALCKTKLIVWNEEMNDIMKIVKCLKESGLLIKGITKTIKNEAKEQKQGFLIMLLGILDASLFKSINKLNHNYSRQGFLMLLHPLTNFEIQIHCENV